MLPIFTPSSLGLDLLASVAAQASPLKYMPSFPALLPAISAAGPFNPTASLLPKVVKKTLELELRWPKYQSAMTHPRPQTTHQHLPAPPVQDISQWVEPFSIMAAILCTRFPEKAPKLWAYQVTIVRAGRNYEGKRWVTYDQQFHRQALAKKDLNPSVMDPRLYNEAIIGQAHSIACCNFCLQDNHLTTNWPHNPRTSSSLSVSSLC